MTNSKIAEKLIEADGLKNWHFNKSFKGCSNMIPEGGRGGGGGSENPNKSVRS